jgi:hypothetical protein
MPHGWASVCAASFAGHKREIRFGRVSLILPGPERGIQIVSRGFSPQLLRADLALVRFAHRTNNHWHAPEGGQLRHRTQRTAVSGKTSFTAEGRLRGRHWLARPRQASQLTWACFPLFFFSATSEWRASQVSWPVNFTASRPSIGCLGSGLEDVVHHPGAHAH